MLSKITQIVDNTHNHNCFILTRTQAEPSVRVLHMGSMGYANLRLLTQWVTVLYPSARHFIHCLMLLQHRKTEKGLNMTEKNVEWNIKHQNKQGHWITFFKYW